MENVISIPQDTECCIVKWKVKPGSRISKNTILAIYQAITSKKQDKLKSTSVGVVKELFVTEGQSVPARGSVLSYEGCQHPIVMKDMCAECGADLREECGLPGDRKSETSASVAMVHSVPELIVSEEQARSLGRADEERLLKNRKLVLLVDLDQTLIHTTNDNIPANLKDVYHFQLWHGRQLLWYHTRFRPGTEKFLQAVSQMYELHIFTFGARLYAHTIAGFLDPKQELFSHRILSRDECFNITSKTANLKALFPCGDSMVCIIDDREDVWNFIPSLVHVKPYNFFEGTADINAPPGLEKGKTKEEGNNGTTKRKSKTVWVPKKKKSEGEKTESSKSEDNKEKDSSQCETEEKTSSDQKTDSCNTENTAEKSDGRGDASSTEVPMEGSDSIKQTKEDEDTFEDDLKLSDDEEEQTEDVETETKEQKAVDSKECGDQIKSGEGEVKDEDGTNSKEDACKDPSSEKEDPKTETTHEDKKSGTDPPKDDEEMEEMVEWEDNDDYLLHLTDILTRIHKAFFQMYDEAKDKKDKEPDLKTIIPYIRKKILKGTNILFSGVIPTNMPKEKSRAYIVAKALGANIHMAFISKEQAEKEGEHTTHVIAAKTGTQKVYEAARHKGTFIVKPDWLWNCNDRWEKVDERLFILPVDKSKIRERGTDSPKPSSSRSTPKSEVNNEPKASTSAQIDSRSFSESINPMAVFSKEELENMDKEVDDLISDSDDDDDDDEEDETEKDLRKRVLGHTPPESSSEDSMDHSAPRGWKNKRKRKRESSFEDNGEDDDDPGNDDPDEARMKLYIEARESPHMVFKRGGESSSSSDDDAESVGSIDDEMIEAIEKEFM